MYGVGFIILLLFDYRDLSLSCAVILSSSQGPPLSVYPCFQVAKPWKLGCLIPVVHAALPSRLLVALSRSIRSFY